MHSAEENNFIVIKLDDGEDVFEALGEIIKKHDIRSALIMSGIGMFRDIEIGYYNGTEYVNEKFPNPMELISMHGSITKGDEAKIHIHVGLANNEHKVYGGHLMKARVCMLNELVLVKMKEMVMTREHNDKTGLLELHVSDTT